MNKKPHPALVIATVAGAACLWFITFYSDWGNFWLKISISSALLCMAGLLFGRRRINWQFRIADVLIGIISALVLYMIFYLGNAVSGWIFGFAAGQVGDIYARGEGTDRWVICLLLFFVTSPSEEIYWRGFLQEQLSGKVGAVPGWLAASAIYALIHLPAWNFMLIGAAAVAGAFWGLLYLRMGRIAPVIISHAVWSGTIFAILPI